MIFHSRVEPILDMDKEIFQLAEQIDRVSFDASAKNLFSQLENLFRPNFSSLHRPKVCSVNNPKIGYGQTNLFVD